MEIKNFISPTLGENIYLLSNDMNECILIDTGDIDETNLIEYIKEKELDLKAILLTHGHFDHILGLEKVLEYKEVPVYMGEADIKFLYESYYSLSHWVNTKFNLDKKYKINILKEDDEIFGLKVIETPGHTEGSLCYYLEEENILFTGDTLFKSAIGRTDFPSGDYSEMLKTLKKLFSLNEDIRVFPGHGPKTTIEKEKKNNYYI